MKHLRLFNTQQEYTSSESNIVSPSVSWVVETDTVYYKTGQSAPAVEMVTFTYSDEFLGLRNSEQQVLKGTTLRQFMTDMNSDIDGQCLMNLDDAQGNDLRDSEEWEALLEQYDHDKTAVPIQDGWSYNLGFC